MINYKKLLCASVVFSIFAIATAQTSSNSPYTRYGYGQLADQSFANGKAMGGIGYGLRNKAQINPLNPASYSAVDSLTMLIDAGISLQNANFNDGSIKTNAKNSSFDYLAMQFRLSKGLGMTIGILPFSTVGYSLYNTSTIGQDTDGEDITATNSYYGDGGLHQVFIGAGYQLFKNLSLGANVSYLYGDINHSLTKSFNVSNANSSVRRDEINIKSLKYDLGLQYYYNLNKSNKINLGLVYSLGQDIDNKGYKYIETYSSSSSTPLSQTKDDFKNAFSLPKTFGIGVSYEYKDKLIVGVDYKSQQWKDTKFYNEKNEFSNLSRVSMGLEYTPNKYSENYLNRIKYRLGGYYSTPYTKVDGEDGAKEYGVSAGFGLPIFQSKSLLSISGQYIKVSPKIKGTLEENYLRINIGLTFNERWFMKWKVE